MQNVVLTQLSIPELGQLFRETLDGYFADKKILVAQQQEDEIGGIDLAVEVTGKKKATIYTLTSQRLIPHSRRGKQLYFSRNELLQWLAAGKRKTRSEILSDGAKISN